MPKENTAVITAAPAEESTSEIELTLQEYCIRRSREDRRVELLGAFHAAEQARGSVKDVTSAFDARFEAFANQPV